jgi:catechol 2,3-dioxygenase-like lactoylglutathione lyase family enzyme
MASGARLATLMPIRNMDRALKFYTRALGAKLNNRGRGEMRDYWASIQLADTEVWLTAPQKREKRTLAYTTFVVKNIKSFVAGLQKKGVKFQKAERMGPQTKLEGPIAYEPFGAAAFFKDPEGNLLMVWQNNPAM